MIYIDDLTIYRGKQDYRINDKIIIHQPNLGEIENHGEKEYFSLVYNLCSVGADLKWQLDDVGIDYTKIADYELFRTTLAKSYEKDKTKILFGDLDLSKFETYDVKKTGEVVMYNKEQDIVIDKAIYHLIVNYLRKTHFIKRNGEIPYNNSTKIALIEEAKENYLLNKNKPYKSQLLCFISTMINIEGFKYNWGNVWEMKIYPFMDSVKRITKIENARLMLQSGYSGYGIDLKKIDNENIDWLGELK